MNRLLIILFLLPAINSLAQVDSSWSKPANVPNTTLLLIDTTTPEAWKKRQVQTVQTWLEQARLSHNTSKGKVYIMPFDNMPCLVPDVKKTVPMPGIKPLPDSRMPNAFRKQHTPLK